MPSRAPKFFALIETVCGRITLLWGKTFYWRPSNGDRSVSVVKALFQSAIERGDAASRRSFLDDDIRRRRASCRALGLMRTAWPTTGSIALAGPRGADPRAAADAEARFFRSAPLGRNPGRRHTRDQPKDNGPNLIDTVIADRYKLRQEIGEGGDGHRLSGREARR